jgi:hypothetical protein
MSRSGFQALPIIAVRAGKVSRKADLPRRWRSYHGEKTVGKITQADELETELQALEGSIS